MTNDAPGRPDRIKHEGTTEGGRDLYVCTTCGSHFSVSGEHETPSRCPWGELHV